MTGPTLLTPIPEATKFYSTLLSLMSSLLCAQIGIFMTWFSFKLGIIRQLMMHQEAADKDVVVVKAILMPHKVVVLPQNGLSGSEQERWAPLMAI